MEAPDIVAVWRAYSEAISSQCIGLESGIDLAKMDDFTYIIAKYKLDNRKHAAPPAFTGKRWTVPTAKECGRVIPHMDVLIDFARFGVHHVSNIILECFTSGDVSAIDVVGTVKTWDPMALSFARLQAHLVKPKDRVPLEVALTTGWDSLQGALKLNNSKGAFAYNVLQDEIYPRLSSYGTKPFKYEQLDDGRFSCQMYCPIQCAFLTIPMSAVLGLSDIRAIIFGGPRYYGKTWYAMAYAKEVAVLQRGEVPIHELRVHLLNSMQAIENAGVKPGDVLMCDDIDLGGSMFWNASPAEYLKNAVRVDVPTQLRICGKVVYIPKGPRLFSSNDPSLKEFLRLKDGEEVPSGHWDAIARRVVWVNIERKIYTDEQHDTELAKVFMSTSCCACCACLLYLLYSYTY